MMLILLAVGVQFRSCMVKQGRRVMEGKEKKGCGMRLGVSADFGGSKEALVVFSCPREAQRAAQCSGVSARRGLVP